MLHHTAQTRWDPQKLVPIVRSIARGLYHLHSRRPRIMHRDIKPANVFVSKPSAPPRVMKIFLRISTYACIYGLAML